MTTTLAGLTLDPSQGAPWLGEPIRLECGATLPVHIAHRRIGDGPRKILLLHALTGGPKPEGEGGWWEPVFRHGAPLDPQAATVWAPNLPGSCYGSVGPEPGRPFPTLTPRDQARGLARWIVAEDLTFDALIGGSLGGMVALELAVLLPDRFRTLGVIGCGGRSDAWIWGTHHIQRRILESDLPDDQAIALARHAAMLTFRAPDGINQRFQAAPDIQGWMNHHGQALAARFTRESYRVLLDAMDAHDLGRGRGGLTVALTHLQAPLHLLGLTSDTLFTPARIRELAQAADEAGRLGSLTWLASPHGHDAFLMEWDQVAAWLRTVLPEAA